MNKKLRFSLLTLLVMLCGTVFAQKETPEVTLDFTGSSWDIPTSGTNKDLATFTNGTYSIKLYSTTNYKQNSGYLILGKANSYLELPAFDFDVEKIVITGNSIASTSVVQNIFVGGVAVSTETTGATSTNTYKIAADKQAAGTIYTLKVTSNHNTQITKIEVYKKKPYIVDFNNNIIVPTSNTASPVFKVSIGWTRIAPSAPGDGYGPYYMRYTYSTDQGVDGTGALLANAQCAPQSSYDGAIETVNDYLVTPKVSGTVTLQVKGTSSASSTYPSFVKFYAINDDATTVGDEITPTFSSEINNDDYVTATLTLTEATRLAIRAQWVYMDNFTATAADVPEVKSLTVASVMNMEGLEGTSGTTTYFEQQQDGTLSVPLKVLLSNTGNVDFVAGTTENYTLTLATASYASGSKTYYDEASVAIPVSLAAGASETVEVTFNIPYPSSTWLYYFVKENVSGTTSSSSRYAGTVAYEPKFVFRAAESTNTSSLSAAQAFGLVSEETTKNFEIANTGIAPLIIKSITLPDGFTSANLPEIPTEGLSIAKGAKQALDITLPATTTGSFSGNLTIVYLDKNAAEQTYTLPFSGNVLPAGTWSADFAGDGGIGYPAGSIAEGGINSSYQYSDGAYNYYIQGRTTSSYASENNKFITPKLHATAGQKLTFDVKGVYGTSYYAKVYVSTDRKTWGEPVAYFTYGDSDGAVAIGSSDWVNKSITFDAEGDYYVAFSLYGEFKIDNIIGLTKVDVAHDLYIKSVSWPHEAGKSVKSGTSLSKPSIDIIPLTDETADAYTVKYVYGENVVNIDSKVLTASASSTTSFSASFTPTVETTTTFPGTKVVFEFADGTKIESEPFDLTVTNEPIFHFVSSLPSSKWNEPSDVNKPIAFGKTNQAPAQSFYVYNWGSAPLTVKSISVPDGFTATPTGQFVVAAFNESDMSVAAQAVEITFSATEAGDYSGNMVITYVNGAGEDATFELAVSGTKLDPTKFYANFGGESNQWPAGSVYQDNVSTTNVNTGDYAITSTSTTDNIFITPKLTAAAGDKLMFDAKLYSSYWNEGKVVVYAAATREEVLNTEEGTTRTQLFAVSGQDETNPMTTDFQTFEVTVPEAGDYFFGFEISNRPYVDEIYGLKAAPVAHDWTIASSNVPAEAMQNVASTATVNILNLGLADEAADAYTAKLYVNGEAVATAAGVAIPMNHKLTDTGTQLSFNFRYPKAGTFPVYIEVKTGDYSVKTAPVDVVFAEEVAKAEATMAAGSTSNTNLLHMNWNNSESVSLYSKAVLAEMGLVEGSKISSITYKGYNTGAKDYSSTLNVWYEFTDDETQTSPSAGKYDTSAMTNVLSTTRSWTAKEGDADNLVDLITINFETPIVYTGKSLRMVVCSEATTYQSGTYFVQSTKNGSNASYYNRNDTQSTFENSQSWSSNSYLPAIYIGLAVEPTTISGTVKNAEGAAVEGATVTLVSADGDNVQYTGTTLADGSYSINVIQANRTYDVTAESGDLHALVEGIDDFSNPVNLTLLPMFNVTDNAIAATVPAKANVTIQRTLKAGWNAIILPFALTEEEVTKAFGENAKLAAYKGDEGTTNVTVKFKTATAMVAGTPYLLWLEATPTSVPFFLNKDITTDITAATGTAFDFVGTYDNASVKAGDFFIKDGKFVKATSNNTVKPFRSYLQVKTAGVRNITFVVGDEEVTGIEGIMANEQTVKNIYNLAGQKVNKAQKGLYIQNGKKVVVK